MWRYADGIFMSGTALFGNTICDNLSKFVPNLPDAFLSKAPDGLIGTSLRQNGQLKVIDKRYASLQDFQTGHSDTYCWQPLATPITFTSLFLSASSTADELTAMPADAIPLSEIQFADNNWSIEEAIYDAPEADANGVITPTAVTGQMRIQYSLDAAEQIDTLQKEYQALEARVTALENA